MENNEELVKTNNIISYKFVYDPNTYNYYDTDINKQISEKINNKHFDDINFIINREFNNKVNIDEKYITIDPFSKLNRDQYFHIISENDISKIPQYCSIEQYLRDLEIELFILEKILEKQQSEESEETEKIQEILKNEDLEQLKKKYQNITINNEKKSKKLLSNILYNQYDWGSITSHNRIM
tara:strand:- start:908 stop:1453 length:546 start_codon:yes stop_codon:yes gene_type:complete